MPDAIWIDRSEEVPALADALAAHATIGLDTEFLRERTFFPKLCLLQVAAGEGIWLLDALREGSLEPLVPALTAPGSRKVIHSARQDLEAFYLNVKRVISPLFDTQIAAGCIGFKPQIGYAELVKTLLDVTLPKGQTRTDWSRRPLSREQLEYAADDVRYLLEVADRLTDELRRLGRERWALEDCAALEDERLYEPDPELSWKRLKGIQQLAPAPRARARALANFRERIARERDLPRQWILADAAIFTLAERNPASRSELESLDLLPRSAQGADRLLDALREASMADQEPPIEARPSPQQRELIERLARVVDAHAASLRVSAEILAPRGELKALAMGARDTQALRGWRRGEIGEKLLDALA